MAATDPSLTERVVVVLAVQPLASETVAEYVVVTKGLTVIDEVVAPEFHKKATPPVAVSVLLPPQHSTGGSAWIWGAGGTNVLMVRLAEAVHPAAFVAITVRAVVAFTIRETLAVVAPLFHR
jgi:hypothetical protein